MNLHFKILHRAMERVLENDKDARDRLIAIQASVNQLARSVYLLQQRLVDENNALRWGVLDTLISKNLTDRTERFTKAEMAEAFRAFKYEAYTESEDILFLGHKNAMDGVKSAKEGAALLRLSRDANETVDPLLRLQRAHYLVPLDKPFDTRIPNTSYWAKSVFHYLKMLDLNVRDYHFDIDSEKHLEDMENKGLKIKEALILSRHPDRLAKFLELQNRTYKTALQAIEAKWTAFVPAYLHNLPLSKAGLLKLFTYDAPTEVHPDYVKIPETFFQMHEQQFQKPLLEKYDSDRLQQGNLVVVFNVDGKEKRVENPKFGWDVVPLLIKLQVHICMLRELEDPKKSCAVEIRPKLVGWAHPKVHAKNLLVAYPKIEFGFATKGMKRYYTVTYSSFRWHGYLKNSPSIKQEDKWWAEESDRMYRLLAENWEHHIGVFWSKHQNPGVWDRDPKPAIDTLYDQMQALFADFSGQLNTVLGAKLEGLENRDFRYFKGGDARYLVEQLEELSAHQELLVRHLTLFAPDFLVTRATEDLTAVEAVLEQTPGRKMLSSILEQLLKHHQGGGTLAFPKNFLETDDFRSPLRWEQAFWISYKIQEHGAFVGAYRRHLEDLEQVAKKLEIPVPQPQCAEVEETLQLLALAKKSHKSFRSFLERRDEVSASMGVKLE